MIFMVAVSAMTNGRNRAIGASIDAPNAITIAVEYRVNVPQTIARYFNNSFPMRVM